MRHDIVCAGLDTPGRRRFLQAKVRALSENFKKQIPEIRTAAQMRIEEKETKSRKLATPE